MVNKTKVGDIQMIEPNEKAFAMTEKVLELNKMIIQQNEMIIRALANPQFIIKNEDIEDTHKAL